jgi:hypothetical protein
MSVKPPRNFAQCYGAKLNDSRAAHFAEQAVRANRARRRQGCRNAKGRVVSNPKSIWIGVRHSL